MLKGFSFSLVRALRNTMKKEVKRLCKVFFFLKLEGCIWDRLGSDLQGFGF